MATGKGSLILRDGRRIAVDYQFANNFDNARAGYLLCDTASLDPAELCYRLTLDCDDGTRVGLAVTHSSDRHLAVTGRVLQTAEPVELDEAK